MEPVFSRLTLAISRQQEYVADELASRICGARNLSQALIALQRSGSAFGAFLYQEFVGVVDAGFRPPLVEGFAHFQSVPHISAQLDESISKEMESGEAGPYSTHPALRQRLAALSELGEIEGVVTSPVDEEMAITLIDDVARVEANVVQSMLKVGTPALTPIDWDEVPSKVLVVRWRKMTQQSLPGLDGLTATIFPEVARRLHGEPDALARQLGVLKADNVEGSRLQAEYILGAALCLVINERRERSPDAVRLTAPPGEPVVFQVGDGEMGCVIEPFAVLDSLKSGTLAGPEWVERCHRIGIADEDLGACCRRVADAHGKRTTQAVLR